MDHAAPDAGFEIPSTLPLLPIRDAVVFPSMILPLFVGRDVSVQAVEAALRGDRMVALVTQRAPDVEEPQPEDLYSIGTAGMVMRMIRLPDGRLKVLVANDSGAAHLGAAVRCPVIAIFGSTSPVWTAPVGEAVKVLTARLPCSPCFRRTCPIGVLCLAEISVEDVARAAEPYVAAARAN